MWWDYENLHEFVYRMVHGQLLLRRQRWFRDLSALDQRSAVRMLKH
jgi:Domain of unknown function (DUF3291)